MPRANRPKVTGLSEDDQIITLQDMLARLERQSMQLWASGDDEDLSRLELVMERVREQLDEFGAPHQRVLDESNRPQRPTPRSE